MPVAVSAIRLDSSIYRWRHTRAQPRLLHLPHDRIEWWCDSRVHVHDRRQHAMTPDWIRAESCDMPPRWQLSASLLHVLRHHHATVAALRLAVVHADHTYRAHAHNRRRWTDRARSDLTRSHRVDRLPHRIE